MGMSIRPQQSTLFLKLDILNCPIDLNFFIKIPETDRYN